MIHALTGDAGVHPGVLQAPRLVPPAECLARQNIIARE
jgi:hypothetical protein